MHPALSVIFFTTLSGAGYGLLFLISAGIAAGLWPEQAPAFVPLAVGTLLAGFGLASSFAHLGRPERAWRAFSQWRTSWLSREGVSAMATFAPVAVLAGAALFSPEALGTPALRACATLAAAGCVVTVYCTARIYSSLKTIRAWRDARVLPAYLLFAVYSGGLWLWVLAAWHARAEDDYWQRVGLPAWLLAVFVLAAMSLAFVKLFYWRSLDTPGDGPTPESATGLGRYGSVTAFERPHTEESYITKEMVFVVARKHAQTLRAAALLSGLALPLAAIGCVVLQPAASLAFSVVSIFAASLGIFVERWLFFAEAKHVVTLYYGSSPG